MFPSTPRKLKQSIKSLLPLQHYDGKEKKEGAFRRLLRRPQEFIRSLSDRGVLYRYIAFGVIMSAIKFTFVVLYIMSVHRFTGPADLYEAVITMSHPIIEGEAGGGGRCREVDKVSMQCLPNIFIIGASKCGTTSVVDFLSRQPRVRLVNRRITPTDRHREIHRFDRNTYAWANPTLELADEWASSPVVEDSGVAVVHYTPHYLYAPSVPYDIKKLYPHSGDPSQMKFVVLLRDPVERALSAYWFANSHLFEERRKQKGEERGFEGDVGSIEQFQQLAEEEMQWRSEYDACMARQRAQAQAKAVFATTTGTNAVSTYTDLEHCFGPLFRSPALGGHHLSKGIYADQLQRWFENFPPESFHITSQERLTADPEREMRGILKFMGADVRPTPLHSDIPDVVSISERDLASLKEGKLTNPNHLKTEQPLPQAFRERLETFFAPHKHRLGELLHQHYGSAAHDVLH
jgi:hypothetical protein